MTEFGEKPQGIPHLLKEPTSTIEYFVSGEGPIVILLPALATPVIEFNNLVEALNSDGFRTVAIHFPGIGKSRRALRPRPTLHTFADIVARVLDDAAVPPTEPVFLIGRALGNRIARTFATQFPDRVAGIVLLGTGGKVGARPPFRIVMTYLGLQIPFLPIRWRRCLLESVICARRNVLPDFACRRPPTRAVLIQAGAAVRTPWQEWWSGGRAPILILQGALDRVAPPENARNLKEEFPERVKLVLIPDAGHAVTYDSPDVVHQEVLSFLQQHANQIRPATSTQI